MNPLLTQIIGIAAGLGFGWFQKHVLTKIPNWTIPLVNTIVGGVLGHFIPGLGGIVGGAVVGGASVGAHQLITQTASGIAKPATSGGGTGNAPSP